VDGHFTKQRCFWQPAAWRLLREAGCVRYARRVVPPEVCGIRIVFPETRVAVGRRVSVTSRGFPGQPLLALLYRPETRDLALDLGMAVLEALHAADVARDPFAPFALIYRVLKGAGILLEEGFSRAPRLSRGERRELRRLVQGYVTRPNRCKVLVHGDLQPSHLIFDPASATLGIIDLEALHVGNPAANFGQLFTGYDYADAALGRALYRRYRERFPGLFDRRFDDDIRAAVALRSYRHVCVARRRGNRELETKALCLLKNVLAGASFAEMCLGTEEG
jgi:hypothetical protein